MLFSPVCCAGKLFLEIQRRISHISASSRSHPINGARALTSANARIALAKTMIGCLSGLRAPTLSHVASPNLGPFQLMGQFVESFEGVSRTGLDCLGMRGNKMRPFDGRQFQ